MYAVEGGNVDIVNVLIAAGANIHQRDKEVSAFIDFTACYEMQPLLYFYVRAFLGTNTSYVCRRERECRYRECSYSCGSQYSPMR